MTPEQYYQSQLTQEGIVADPAQAEAINALQRVYDELMKGPHKVVHDLMVELSEDVPMHVYDRFELTERGWRSSTVRKHFARGLTLREFRRGRLLVSDIRKDIRDSKMSDPKELDRRIEEFQAFLEEYQWLR